VVISTLLLGIAETYFEVHQLDRVIQTLDKIISEYHKSDLVREATYFWGVSGYKLTRDRSISSKSISNLETDIHKLSRQSGDYHWQRASCWFYTF